MLSLCGYFCLSLVSDGVLVSCDQKVIPFPASGSVGDPMVCLGVSVLSSPGKFFIRTLGWRWFVMLFVFVSC